MLISNYIERLCIFYKYNLYFFLNFFIIFVFNLFVYKIINYIGLSKKKCLVDELLIYVLFVIINKVYL